MNAKATPEVLVDEDGLEYREVVITRGAKTRTFIVKEAAYGLIQKIGVGLNHHDAAKKLQNLENFGSNMIAASVYENGVRLTEEQASALPGTVGKKLQEEALSINAMDAAAKEEAKNE